METCIYQFYTNKSRIALQVARKIAPCDWAFSNNGPIMQPVLDDVGGGRETKV